MADQIPLHFKLHETVKIIKKRKVLIICTSILFLIIPIYLFFFNTKIYKTHFTICYPIMYEGTVPKMNEEHTTNFDKQVVIELIKNFNLTYSKKKKYKITKTNNPINIPKFESIIVLETIYEKSSSLVLETYVYDIQDIEIISLDLLNYINSNQYVKSYFEIERSKYEAIRKRIEERIKEMETMKNLLVTSKSMVFFNILKDISSMEERNADILNIINKLNGFEIAVDPTVPLKPEGIGLTYFVLFGFAGLFTGILLSLFIEKVLFLN